MVRIFFTLAVFAVALLAANLLLGLFLGDFGESTTRYAQAVARHKSLQRSDTATRSEITAAEDVRRQAHASLVTVQQNFRPHIWLGIVAALVTVLVNCISVTYFIGTSRWCREVVDAYGLEWEFADRSRRLKRKSFPFAVLGLLTTVGLVALGGAADPAGNSANAAQWVTPHAVAAMLGLAAIAAAFLVQGRAVAANYRVIQEILVETQRIRSLPSVQPQTESLSR